MLKERKLEEQLCSWFRADIRKQRSTEDTLTCIKTRTSDRGIPQTGLCMYHYQTLDNAGAIMVAIGKSSATGFERMMHRNSLRAVPCGLRPQNELAPVPSLHYIACSENNHSSEAISIFGQVEVNAVVW